VQVSFRFGRFGGLADQSVIGVSNSAATLSCRSRIPFSQLPELVITQMVDAQKAFLSGGPNRKLADQQNQQVASQVGGTLSRRAAIQGFQLGKSKWKYRPAARVNE
jgi:hypothetical protein